MNYTVFFEQVHRTNFQVKAASEEEAEEKATKLYGKQLCVPFTYVQEEWIAESDGEDK